MTDYAAECFVIFTMASVGGFEELDTLFNKACSYVQTFASQFKSEQLLYFYSRYKQVSCCLETVKKFICHEICWVGDK